MSSKTSSGGSGNNSRKNGTLLSELIKRAQTQESDYRTKIVSLEIEMEEHNNKSYSFSPAPGPPVFTLGKTALSCVIGAGVAVVSEMLLNPNEENSSVFSTGQLKKTAKVAGIGCTVGMGVAGVGNLILKNRHTANLIKAAKTELASNQNEIKQIDDEIGKLSEEYRSIVVQHLLSDIKLKKDLLDTNNLGELKNVNERIKIRNDLYTDKTSNYAIRPDRVAELISRLPEAEQKSLKPIGDKIDDLLSLREGYSTPIKDLELTIAGKPNSAQRAAAEVSARKSNGIAISKQIKQVVDRESRFGVYDAGTKTTSKGVTVDDIFASSYTTPDNTARLLFNVQKTGNGYQIYLSGDYFNPIKTPPTLSFKLPGGEYKALDLKSVSSESSILNLSRGTVIKVGDYVEVKLP